MCPENGQLSNYKVIIHLISQVWLLINSHPIQDLIHYQYPFLYVLHGNQQKLVFLAFRILYLMIKSDAVASATGTTALFIPLYHL